MLLFCLLIGGFSVAAQTAGIKRSYAFISLHQPGSIMVRPDGMPVHAGPDTLLTVYLEIPVTFDTSAVVWKNAWMNGVSYSFQLFELMETPLEAGTLKGSRKKVVLTAAKDYGWWRLVLAPAERKSTPAKGAKPGQIILEGKQGRKKILLDINSLAELESIPSV
jgi:hypothetical protein